MIVLVIALNLVAAFEGDHHEEFFQEHLISRTVKLRTVELKVKQQYSKFDSQHSPRRRLKQLQQPVIIQEKLKFNSMDFQQDLEQQQQQQSVSSDWWSGPGDVANQYLVILSTQKIPKDFKQLLEQTLDDQGTVLSFIPNGTYVILSTPHPLQKILQLQNVLTIIQYLPAYKISPEINQIYNEFKTGNIFNSSYWNFFEGIKEGSLVLKVEIVQGGEDWIDMEVVDREIEKILGGMCGPAHMGMCRWGRREHYNYGISKIPIQILFDVVVALSDLPFVHWMEGVERMQVLNFFANSIVQGGTVGLTTTHRPFWDAGLTGAGQVVGVGDTGLDFDSCFFRDPNVSQPGVDHRKVMAYRTIGDQVDGSGHGTHVCGTIAGSVAEGRAQNHNGLAPDAKIAFTDLGTGRDKFLKLPEEGMERYYSWGYEMGVRLHSDSWGGGPSGGYRYTSRDADRFMWEHPDFLAILAAGNEGEAYGEQATINSLAACKNAIAVGATLGPFGTLPKVEGETLYLKIVEPEDVVEVVKAVNADFGPNFYDVLSDSVYEMTAVIPVTACINQTQELEGDYRGKILLVARGECKYLDKVLAAQQAGAAGILIYNIDDQRYGYSTMMIPQALKGNNTVYIPAANIPLSTAKMLLRISERNKILFQTLEKSIVQKKIGVIERFDNIALFSSFGPTDDDRIKPDLVAPGEAIRSAYGDGDPLSNNCQTAQLTGTSMATPIVAGAALLVRQYFVDGFYPTQYANLEDSFIPSSALIKAVLINGAVDLKGVSETGLPLESSPSVRQGWGRVNLGSSLPLVNTSTFSLYISDDIGLAQDENFYLCVKIPPFTSEFPLTATLVWTDPPADLSATDQILVNDLDLKIISPPGLPKSSRGAAPDPDRKNNVEQEFVQQPVPNSSYFILINAFQVAWPRNDTNDQPFALVITGPPGMMVEECGDACTTCPSSPTSQSAVETSQNLIGFEEITDFQDLNGSVMNFWNQTALQFDDPCVCSETGVDAGTGVNSFRRGCARHALEFGVEMRYCYVVDSIGCGKGAYPSRRVPGVSWRECNLFEEMYSMAIPRVPVGVEPQFVQNEDLQDSNSTEDVISKIEEFEDQVLNLTVILEPVVPTTLVPMEQTQTTKEDSNSEQQIPQQFQEITTQQPAPNDIVVSFEDLFNVTWQVNQNINERNQNINQSDQGEFQDEIASLSLQLSPPYYQYQYQQQQQQQQQQSVQIWQEIQQSIDEENYLQQLSGLAAIQAFQYNPRNFSNQNQQDLLGNAKNAGNVRNAQVASESVASNASNSNSFQQEPIVEILQDDVTFVPIAFNSIIVETSVQNDGTSPVPELYKIDDVTFVPIDNTIRTNGTQIQNESVPNLPNLKISKVEDDVTFVPIVHSFDDVTSEVVPAPADVTPAQFLSPIMEVFKTDDVTFVPFEPIAQSVPESTNALNVPNVQNVTSTSVRQNMQNANDVTSNTKNAINASFTMNSNDDVNSNQVTQIVSDDNLFQEPVVEIQNFDQKMQQNQQTPNQLRVIVDIESKEGPLNEQEEGPLWVSVWGVDQQNDQQQIQQQQLYINDSAFQIQQDQFQLLEGLIELVQIRDDQNG